MYGDIIMMFRYFTDKNIYFSGVICNKKLLKTEFFSALRYID